MRVSFPPVTPCFGNTEPQIRKILGERGQALVISFQVVEACYSAWLLACRQTCMHAGSHVSLKSTGNHPVPFGV